MSTSEPVDYGVRVAGSSEPAMIAGEVASRDLITVGPDATLKQAAALLFEHSISALPVVEGGDRLVGMLTDTDLLQLHRLADPTAHLWLIDPEPGALPGTVRELMTTAVVALPESADLSEVSRVMLTDRVRHVPLVDGERLMGIVSRRDLLKVLVRDDDTMRAEATELLATAPQVWGTWEVDVTDGRVRLHGVGPQEHSQLARRIVGAVSGVLEVEVDQ